MLQITKPADLRELRGGNPRIARYTARAVYASLLFFAFAFTSPALVQATEQSENITQINADDEAGTVTIVINGKKVGQFTEDGLRVLGDISYGGMIADFGREETARRMGGAENAPAQEAEGSDAE